MENKRTKKAVSLEGFIFLAIFLGIFSVMVLKMGGVNMLNTLMNTGYQLLMETVFYIMAITVLAGAISGLFSEFGVISMINKLLSPLMKPLYNLPAAGAAIGLVPHMAEAGTVLANDVAVFTAMCMCLSGYLSTHVAMMSSLKENKLTGKAILSHTIGGLCAGIAAHWLFKLFILIF